MALSPRVFDAQAADQLAGLEIIGGERGVGGVDRIERRIEHDHEKAGVAGLLNGRNDCGRIARDDGKALGAGRDQALDSRDLAFVVAVIFAGEGLQLDPSSFAFSSAPSFILTKNGLLSVLVIRPTISAAMAGTAPAMANRATPRANDLRVDVTKTSLTLFGAILNQSKAMLLE